MKKYVLLIGLLMQTVLYAQNFLVESTELLDIKSASSQVKFDDSGDLLLFMDYGDNLNLYDLTTKNKKVIDKGNIDIRSTAFTKGDEIYYPVIVRENNLLYKDLYKYDISEGQKELVEQKVRNLTPPRISADRVDYTVNKKMKTHRKRNLNERSSTKTEYYVAIENQHLVLYVNGEPTILDPLGKGSYVTPSLSPDENQILFVEVRKGVHIYNIGTGEIKSLGQFTSPVWINDAWIAGVESTDDGHNYLTSQIFVIDTNGRNKQYISSSEDISTSPVAAVNGNKVAYTTDEGKIYIVKYTLK